MYKNVLNKKRNNFCPMSDTFCPVTFCLGAILFVQLLFLLQSPLAFQVHDQVFLKQLQFLKADTTVSLFSLSKSYDLSFL